MTKSIFGILALVTASFLVGCAAEPVDTEEQGSTESHQTREESEKKRAQVNDVCPTAEDSVTRSYYIALSRAPDDAGLAYWINEIESGNQSRISVLRNIIRAPEFTANRADLDNDGFVLSLYSTLLGRSPDEGGAGYWLGQLNAGISRTEIALAFVNSPEFNDFSLNVNAACYFE